MSFKKKLLPLALAQVIAGGAFSVMSIAPAMAQEATSAPVQRVEITGSNIRRADAETSSPVQVITADDLKKSGYTTVSDVLKNITANGQGTLSSGNSEAFAGGGNGVALRGLTVGATLVLIDGHRMAPYPLSDDGERQFVDITAIPFDTVDRIEVLKDGASSVYGSDAIAGVVNVILKKTFTGTQVTADVGGTSQGGGNTNHASIISGFGDLDADGYTAYISLEARHQDVIHASDRSGQSFVNQNWAPQGGNNLNPGAVNQFNGGTPGNTKNPYLLNPNGDSTQASSYAFYPGQCNFAALGNNACQYQNTWTELSPPQQNVNLLGSFTKKLGGDWEMNVKASIFQSTGEQILSGIGGANTFPGASYGGAIAINGNGTGLPPAFQAGLIPSFTVPVNYPGNTLGVPGVPYGQIPGIGAESEDFKSNTYRLVADFNGTYGAWDLFASVGYTRITTDITYNNFVNYTNLYNALNAPNGSAGQFLLSGNNSAALINSIAPKFGATDTDELDFVEARGSRDLFKLDGGAFSVGTGFEFIHKSLNAPLAGPVDNGTIGGVFNPYVFGQQNDASLYGEFIAPVLKTLELDGSARFDHYNTYGNSTTPKLGFKWTPNDIIAIRGTASEGFRAPTAAENGTAGLAFGLGQTVADPLLCPNGAAAKGAAVNQCNVSLGYIQTTNPNLAPEKSKSVTLGAIIEPIKGWSSTLDYYNIAINNQIVSSAQLSSFVPVFIRGVPTAQTISNGDGTTSIGTPAVGNIQAAFTSYQNANTTRTAGLEFTTRYKFKLGDLGSLTTSLDVSHMLKYELTANGTTYELAGTHGPSGISGDTGNPKDKLQFVVGYDQGPLNVTTSFNWTSSYSIEDPSASANFHSCEDSAATPGSLTTSTSDFAAFPGTQAQLNQAYNNYCKVNSFLDTDLSVSYKFGKNWTVHGSITNLFNQAPPLDLQTYAGSFLPYNPSLALTGAIGRAYNIGAVYKF